MTSRKVFNSERENPETVSSGESNLTRPPQKGLLGMAPLGDPGYVARHMAPLPARYSGLPNRYGYRVGPGVDLQGAALTHADLRWHNLRGANLREANLQHAVLWGANLINADLSGADLCNTDFTGADLVGADLSDARLNGTSFIGARYSRYSTVFPKGFGSPQAHGLVAVDVCQEVG